MSDQVACPALTLEAGSECFGFRVLRAEQMPEIRVTAYELEHVRTGAKLLHIHCTDSENLFSVGFRTPPHDSTGVAHILEHSVLSGSKAYPVKDAFNELMKGTLQTFINAFTYPDKTVYPVASQVKTDYFNLARVYCDLVFHPLLRKETFLQEGHHLEYVNPDDPESDLTVSGIVFNEMKGAYSSPDSLMYKYLLQSLYPDTPYAHDSGGDPRMIPSLTYEQFLAFHRSYYSASNARFFLYGDIPTIEHLAFLEEVLADQDRVEIDSCIPSQPARLHPLRISGYYPVAKDETLADKTAINLAWLTAENADQQAILILEILTEVLVGNAAGPLRKALIESGLGEDLSPVTGLDADLKQVFFGIGLRGSEAERVDQVERIVLDTLEKLASEGIDRQLLEGAFHQIEISGKEIIRGSMPYGITLMQRAYTAWLYDADPLVVLNFPQGIAEVRERWESDPELFQRAIRRWFLDNPHRVLSIVEPSPTFEEEAENDFRKEMTDLKAKLSEEQREGIHTEASHLKELQAQHDSPEALATLPELKRSDLSRRIETIASDEVRSGDVIFLRHDIFTNGIVYLDLAFDLSCVSEADQPYLPLLGRFMTSMGASGLNYEEMAKRVTLKTGGIGCSPSIGMTLKDDGHWQKMIFSTHALYRHIPDAVALVRAFLCEADFSDRNRMRDLLLEARNRLRAAVVPSGHVFAKRSAAAALNLAAHREEVWWGVSQLRFLADLADRFEHDGDALLDKIESLYRRIVQRNGLLINITADGEGLALLGEELNRMMETLPEGDRLNLQPVPVLKPVHTGISIPAQVCYVARVAPVAVYREPLSGSLSVLSRLLSNDYLYNRIRVQGGAYGGMCQYDPAAGLLSFLSYRDPHLIETLKVYEEVADYVLTHDIGERDLEKAVIGTIGQLDRPMDPAGKGSTAMIRYLAGLTDEMRQDYRNRILDTTVENVMEAARRYLVAEETAVIAVYAAGARLQEANETLARKLEIAALP